MQNLKGNKGQGLIEYILIVGLMGVLAIFAVNQLGETTKGGYEKATNTLSTEFARFGR